MSHPIRDADPGLRRSLVLSGGGARGAYEVGVLAYLFNELPELAGERAGAFPILSGTSVGAINASFLASRAHLPRHDIDRLAGFWRGLRLGDVLRVGAADLARLPWDLGALWRQQAAGRGILVNTGALTQLISHEVDWPQIQANIGSGVLDALTVSATHIHSGKTVVFVDNGSRPVPVWSRDTRKVARKVIMSARHALASAAIPIVFPAVDIDGAFYCDGGLRQNTPLSPALRLGADRALVVAVGHGQADQPVPAAGGGRQEAAPGLTLLLGKIFNALLLDHLDYDLAQLSGLNQLMDDGQRAFGPEFSETLGRTADGMRGQRYRRVACQVVRPSQDLGHVAAELVRRRTVRAGGAAGWLLRALAENEISDRADLLSYILFDGHFAQALIELGMADADAQREQLREFFR